MQLSKDARQLAARHMKERGIGENPMKVLVRQIEPEKVLVPSFAAAVSAGQFHKPKGAVQSYGSMSQVGKRLEIATRSAAEIEYGVRRLIAEVTQQGRDVLTDVVVAGAFEKGFGIPIVMRQGNGGDFFQRLRIYGRPDSC